MSDVIENTGVTPEVADPEVIETEEGVTPEVADPEVVEGATKRTADEAWANMRRRAEDAEKRAREAEERGAELEAQINARAEAVKRLGGNENADITALAESLGADPEEVLAALEAEQVSAQKDLEIERLKAKVNSVNAEKAMQEDLAEIQKINPNVKSLEELGESYVNYIKAGLSATEAYFAVERKDNGTKVKPPEEIGRVDNKPPEKDYFTEAEVDAMTPREQKLHWKKIKESMKKW